MKTVATFLINLGYGSIAIINNRIFRYKSIPSRMIMFMEHMYAVLGNGRRIKRLFTLYWTKTLAIFQKITVENTYGE